jgi:hypothetical protein
MSTRSIVVALLALTLVLAPQVGEARLLELTFDDADDGSGHHDGHAELDNMESQTPSLVHVGLTAKLTGTTRRSAFEEGRYGRAADFPGGKGAIEIVGWEEVAGGRYAVHMWVKPRAVEGGNLIELVGRFSVGFEDGKLVARAARTDGEWSIQTLGAKLEADGEFHHVALEIDVEKATLRVTLYLDFERAGEVDVPMMPLGGPPLVRVGAGLDGMIDELMISPRAVGAGDLFDYSPEDCFEKLSCLEEVIATVPTDFPHRVPVRFKSVYDPEACTPSHPCPLLFDISGGGKCADDYSGAVDVFARAGFVAVTVDLYCEGDDDTREFPTETSQLIAVKDHMFKASPLRERIAGPEYHATGCSHGAGTVLAWSLRETDHPARTYARSAGIDGHCALHAGEFCPAISARLEAQVVQLVGAHDEEDSRVQELHAVNTNVEMATAEVVSSRQLALSWGINLEGPICREDGNPACNEEGLWAMRYGGRRLRDHWLALEDDDRPTGYFVEDHSTDCRHCAVPSGHAFQCGLCLLVHGREGMQEECPGCLDYSEPDIEFGAKADPCRIEASWYRDPVTASSD